MRIAFSHLFVSHAFKTPKLAFPIPESTTFPLYAQSEIPEKLVRSRSIL